MTSMILLIMKLMLAYLMTLGKNCCCMTILLVCDCSCCSLAVVYINQTLSIIMETVNSQFT